MSVTAFALPRDKVHASRVAYTSERLFACIINMLYRDHEKRA